MERLSADQASCNRPACEGREAGGGEQEIQARPEAAAEAEVCQERRRCSGVPGARDGDGMVAERAMVAREPPAVAVGGGGGWQRPSSNSSTTERPTPPSWPDMLMCKLSIDQRLACISA